MRSSALRQRASAPARVSRKVAVRAVAEGIVWKKIAPLVWEEDKESIADVFMFGGSAPERCEHAWSSFICTVEGTPRRGGRSSRHCVATACMHHTHDPLSLLFLTSG
jgi:hypothetical protein